MALATPDLVEFYEALSRSVEGQEAHTGGVDAMHRMLRDPNDPNRPPSAAVINELVLEQAPDEGWLYDAGCGWGGTVFHLLAHSRLNAIGVTLSAHQHAYAQNKAQALGLDDRALFLRTDYTLPTQVLRDVSIATFVESLHHSRDSVATCLMTARVLARAGRIIIIDDFLNRDDRKSDPAVDAFVSDWRFSRLWPIDEFLRSLRDAGLKAREIRDLSSLFDPRTPDALEALIAEKNKDLSECSEHETSRQNFLMAERGGFYLEQLYNRGLARYSMVEISV